MIVPLREQSQSQPMQTHTEHIKVISISPTCLANANTHTHNSQNTCTPAQDVFKVHAGICIFTSPHEFNSFKTPSRYKFVYKAQPCNDSICHQSAGKNSKSEGYEQTQMQVNE